VYKTYNSRSSNLDDSKYEFDKHEFEEEYESELRAAIGESLSDEEAYSARRPQNRKLPAILKGEYDDESDDGEDLVDFVVGDDEDPGYYQKSSTDRILEDDDEEEDEEDDKEAEVLNNKIKKRIAVGVDEERIDVDGDEEAEQEEKEERDLRLHPDIYRDDTQLTRYATLNDALQVRFIIYKSFHLYGRLTSLK